ncbi:MAG TPA: glycosyltransferase family 4 protein [Acidimicrobiales bacterium]|nr:glycosyltransferase family 4 protein [Acidimicrobiales bacterium]
MNRRPRLLVLASTFPSTADDPTPAFVRDLALVESEAYDTTVLVPAVPGSQAQEQLGPVQVRRFRFFPKRWEDLADGAILENLRTRPSRRFQVVPFMVAETLAVSRLVRRLKPDVIHAHWLIPQGLAALLAARGVPMLVTTLGGDLYGLRDPLSRRVIRAVVGRAQLVTTMNADMRRRLLELGADPDRCRVLPMGARTESVRNVAGKQQRVPGRILFVGRLVEKKGPTVLLEALRSMSIGQLDVHVVGDGPMRAELERGASGLPVRFLGGLGPDRLAEQYGQAAIAVFPSVRAASGDQDGLPVALLEAMAAGCAIVASDLPGLSDAVIDQVSGRLVPSGDPAALAAALSELLSDPALCRRFGQAASERSEQYSVASVGARYVELLEEVRSGGHPRSADAAGPAARGS